MRKVLRPALIVAFLLLSLGGALLLLRNKPLPKPERPVPQIAYSDDDFQEPSAHKTNEITVFMGKKLTVSLDLNPTIPLSWEKDARNSNPAVIKQVNMDTFYNPLPPGVEPMPGRASSTYSWSFEPLKTGSAILQFNYCPWDTNELEVLRSLKLTVNVR